MRFARFHLIWGAALLLVVFATTGNCEEPKNSPWEKFAFNLGGMTAASDSSVRLGLPGVGVEVDLEEALNVDTSFSMFRIEGLWRFTGNRRHRLDFQWYRINRRGTKTLDRVLEGDDITIPIGTTVETTLNFDIYKAAYSYSFFQDDRIDLAVALGLYVMPVSYDIDAKGFVQYDVSSEFTAPLPVLGLRSDFAITEKWFLRSSIDIFYLEYDKFKGRIADIRILTDYNFMKHLGAGIGVESTRIAVESEDDDYSGMDFVGNLRMDTVGVFIYGKIYF